MADNTQHRASIWYSGQDVSLEAGIPYLHAWIQCSAPANTDIGSWYILNHTWVSVIFTEYLGLVPDPWLQPDQTLAIGSIGEVPSMWRISP